MRTYAGILGDPAKAELYDDDFFRIMNWDQSNSTFHLLGASENDVDKRDYRTMFNRFDQHLSTGSYDPIPGLSNPNSHKYTTRIGLFPSSSTHLIKGPSFSFAPYPVNSSSNYLKFKSKFLQFVLNPFLPFILRSLAYFPLGGKAARKTKADLSLSNNDLINLFYQIRQDNKFDWYYLEAGSGQEFLDFPFIQSVMKAQFTGIYDERIDIKSWLTTIEPGSRIMVPNAIYGGGIRTKDQLRQIIGPDPSTIKFIPEVVIIGNLSEENIEMTYTLIDLLGEMNELPFEKINTVL